MISDGGVGPASLLVCMFSLTLRSKTFLMGIVDARVPIMVQDCDKWSTRAL